MHRQDRQGAGRAPEAALAAHRRLFLPPRRHADRRVLAGWKTSRRRVGAGPGRAHLSRTRIGAHVGYAARAAGSASPSRAGSRARMMPPITATPAAPAAMISATAPAAIPPMAMIGTALARQIAAIPAGPSAGP